MKKVLFAFTCLCGLCGCLNMNDDSTIDESSIVITRGKIRDVYVEAYVDVEAKGLKGIDVVLPNKQTGYNRIHEMGYTMIYEVYDSQGKLVALILRLKIINQPLSTATRKFRLVKDSTDTTP